MKLTILSKERRISYGYIMVGYFNVAANILLNILLMKKLSVGNFGMVSIGRAIFQSFEFSHFGIRYGFDRSLPVCMDKDKKMQLFWAGLLFTAFFSLLFVLFWSLFYVRAFYFYIFFILSGFLYALIQLYRIYFRAGTDKWHFFQISLFSVLMPTALQIIFFLVFGVWGLLISMFGAYIGVGAFVFIRYKVAMPVLTRAIWDEGKKLLSQGFLLFLTAILSFLTTSGDRILMEKYWGIEAVGQYSIIIFVFSTLAVFPVNYTELIMSEIIRRKSFRYIVKHSMLLMALTVSFCILSLIIIPYVLPWILPNYVYLYPHMKIIIWAAVPSSVLSLLNYYLHATDNRNIVFVSNLVSTLAYFIALLVILKAKMSIDYVLICKISFFTLNVIILVIFSIIIASKQPKEVGDIGLEGY